MYTFLPLTEINMRCVAILLALVAVTFATKSWDDLRPRVGRIYGDNIHPNPCK